MQKKRHTFCQIKKKLYLCIAIEKNNGSIAQLNRAFDYGSKGYRFESYWSHSKQETNSIVRLFFFFTRQPPIPQQKNLFYRFHKTESYAYLCTMIIKRLRTSINPVRAFRIILLLLPMLVYGQSKSFEFQPQPTQQLKLLFVGDLMQHQAQIDAALRADGSYDYTHCFSLVKERISRADLAIGNLEVTLGGEPYRGYPQFSAPDEYIYALRDAGFDILSTANNHSLDRRRRGLERTLTLIDSTGLVAMGTYRDESDRQQRYPLLIEKNGIRIAFLCATYGTNGIGVTHPNIVNSLDRTELAKDIQQARAMRPDAIIAILHWGNEYQQLPNTEQRDLARWLIDEGVDHVIGSHPHVIQPIESIDSDQYPTQHMIAYSLGNYVSNMSIPHGDVGLVVELTLEKRGYVTRIKQFDYDLVWTERAALSRTANFRIIPSDTIPDDLSMNAQLHMQKAINTEKDFLKNTLK